MSGHTPGPWRVNFSKFAQVVTQDGALVATCNRLTSLTNLQANSRLVAVSPEMFSILQRLAALSDGLRNGNSSAEEAAGRLAEESRQLIARATGVQS